MKPGYLILLIVMNCFWAGTLSVFKALGNAHLDPGAIVTLRFGIAGIIWAVVWPWLPGRAPRGWDLVKTAAMGVIVFSIGQRVQVLGNKYSTAGNSSVLMGMEPIITSVAAAIFLREHIGPRRWIGFALGGLGVAMLNGFLLGGFQWADLAVSVIFTSSFVCEALYSIMGKPLIERGSLMKVLVISLAFGTAANLLYDGRQTLAEARALPVGAWWQVLYLAVICTAIGHAVWFVAIRKTDVNLVAMTIFTQPVAGVAIATLWLHEKPHLGQLWGSLAIVAGLIVGLSRQIKRAPD